MNSLKQLGARVLEAHPLGYVVGVWLITHADVLLPHEQDYWGFRLLASGKPDGLFLDLGANAGHSARGFMKIVPGWRVLSIEANPAHQRTLHRIALAHQNFRFLIRAIDRISNEFKTIHVPYYRGLAMHSSAAMTLEDARSGIELSFPRHLENITYAQMRVETITIDDLNVQPNIIKLDIQGKELAALQGAEATLRNCSPDLLVELVLNPAPIVEFLRDRGYEAYEYDHSRAAFTIFAGRLSRRSRNVFFSRRNLSASSN
jgi:FkbM family methyltransferase